MTSPIRRLAADDLDAVTDVLRDSFADYPVMRFVLGPEAGRGAPLQRLVRFFATARFLREEPVFGLRSGEALVGVALVSHPDGPASPPELGEAREELWQALGPGARERYEAFGAATRPLTVDVPHVHLNMIGVRGSAHGQGHGRRLLERVHRHSAEHPGSRGVTLTTEDPDNLPLYEHFGYRLVGTARVTDELRTWGMFRPDS